MLEVGFADGRPRDLWRRVRFVIDQARAFAESTGPRQAARRRWLARLPRWADLQSAEGARVVETVLPETDDDAVRILTIHGAKGLEFPITIVSGMTTGVQQRRSGVQLVFPHDSDTYALRIVEQVTTEEFERYMPIDEQMDFHEKLRLLYVALDPRPRPPRRVGAPHGSQARPNERPEVDPRRAAVGGGTGPLRTGTGSRPLPRTTRRGRRRSRAARVPFPAWDDWSREQRAARSSTGAAPRVRSATAIATAAAARERRRRADPGLAKDARDLELPPWNKGRYGTAVGRAVHAVLQTVDLRTGDGIDDTAPRRPRPRASSGGRTTSPRSPAARSRRPPCTKPSPPRSGARCTSRTPVGGHTLEGYVDLVYRTPRRVWSSSTTRPTRGATSPTSTPRSRAYRLQGASYALAVEAATGEPVARCVFLFLGTDGADEREVTTFRGDRAGTSTSLGVRRIRMNTSTPPIGPVRTTSAV